MIILIQEVFGVCSPGARKTLVVPFDLGVAVHGGDGHAGLLAQETGGARSRGD